MKRLKIKATEADVLSGVKAYLLVNGWRVKRMPPSIYSAGGIADLYAIKDGIGIWIECKNPDPKKGKVSDEQRKFAEDISAGGGLYIIARSVDTVHRAIQGLWMILPDLNGERGMAFKPRRGMRLEVIE